jgi:hypothetical protein
LNSFQDLDAIAGTGRESERLISTRQQHCRANESEMLEGGAANALQGFIATAGTNDCLVRVDKRRKHLSFSDRITQNVPQTCPLDGRR